MELLKLLCYKKRSLFGEVNYLNRKMKGSDNEGWSGFKNGKLGKKRPRNSAICLETSYFLAESSDMFD